MVAVSVAVVAGACAYAGPGGGGSSVRVLQDDAGDAVVRRTDSGMDGVINEDAIPDFLSVRMSAWSAPDPVNDPYAGVEIETGDLLRIQMVFDGLLNPPGPLGLGAFSFDPYRFGDRPVYGLLELDIDNDNDTGGELSDAMQLRYLANVGRFGAVPYEDDLSDRMALSADDYDGDFNSGPQLERSGADFVFGFCGCYDITLVSENGDIDGVFEAGESFVVRGRFFRRSGGYEEASAVFGGTLGGHYDPFVNIRFDHDTKSDTTTITLVDALTMSGAAMLAGEAEQSPDFQVDNHHSVFEAVLDLIDGANGLNGPLSPEAVALVDHWFDRSPQDVLSPKEWRVTALFGTTYSTAQAALYVWTDVGFDEQVGDLDNNGVTNTMDELSLASFIAANDGAAMDGGVSGDGVVTIMDAGPNFHLFDLDGDGSVSMMDAIVIQNAIVLGDLNGDGKVNAVDLSRLLGAWGTADLAADITGDGNVNASDLSRLLGAWTTSSS